MKLLVRGLYRKTIMGVLLCLQYAPFFAQKGVLT